MGIFQFLKDAGAKIFHFKKKEEAPETVTNTTTSAEDQAAEDQHKAAQLTATVRNLGLDIDNLDIEVNRDFAVIRGATKMRSEKEKAVLAIGNIDGIAEVDDQIELITEDPAPEATFYTVEKGDSLSKIAKHFYGNAMKYPVIFEANKPMLKHPDLIYPGQVLRIPALEA